MTNDKCKFPMLIWFIWLIWHSLAALPLFLHTLYLFKRYKDLENVLGRIVASEEGEKHSLKATDLKATEQKCLARVSHWLTKVFMPLTEGRCLMRSLLLYRLIKQKGYTPEFYAGVRRQNGVLQSHAWVEVDGHCVEGTNDHLVRHSYTVNICSKDFMTYL